MFKNIAPDKWRHFYVGILMGLVLQAFAVWLLPQNTLAASIAVLGLVIAISYGFELFSKITGKGHYEVADAVASIIGGILGMGGVLGIVFVL